MPIEFQVDHEQMYVIKNMMERMWGFRFLQASADDAQAGAVVAEHTDAKGKKWVARCSIEANPAQVDQARQILAWFAAQPV